MIDPNDVRPAAGAQLHRPIDVYSGNLYCVDDGVCHYEDDYDQPNEQGEWCPHVKCEGSICLHCSDQNDDGEWPSESSVSWPCPAASHSGETQP